MSFRYIQKMPPPEDILIKQPLPKHLSLVKEQRDLEIAGILKGTDKRFLIIIGPCSAHNEDAVCEYTVKLAALQERVKEKILIIPRIYTNKPRTTGTGYKGMFHQPDPRKDPDVVRGVEAIRHMHIRAFAESGLTVADEMLYPENYPYLEDLLSYVAIGARSVENQQHRLTVSGLEIPIGMKNPTSGDFKVLLDSVYAATRPHRFVYNGWDVATTGNNLAHSVLRGAVNLHGNHIPNYHYEDLMRLSKDYIDRGFENPAIIIDTNHSNSGKQYREQPRIAFEILHSRKLSELLYRLVRGLMIESYLLEGAQSPDSDEYGRSITDPCLGWEDSESLVLEMADIL